MNLTNKCFPKCNSRSLIYLGDRKNPAHPQSSDYGLVGCIICGTLWELRPDYEVESIYGGGPSTEFEVSMDYATKNYPNIKKVNLAKIQQTQQLLAKNKNV
jgi:hypothetical protein